MFDISRFRAATVRTVSIHKGEGVGQVGNAGLRCSGTLSSGTLFGRRAGLAIELRCLRSLLHAVSYDAVVTFDFDDASDTQYLVEPALEGGYLVVCRDRFSVLRRTHHAVQADAIADAWNAFLTN